MSNKSLDLKYLKNEVNIKNNSYSEINILDNYITKENSNTFFTPKNKSINSTMFKYITNIFTSK